MEFIVSPLSFLEGNQYGRFFLSTAAATSQANAAIHKAGLFAEKPQAIENDANTANQVNQTAVTSGAGS